MADWALPQLGDLKVDVLGMLKQRDTDAMTLAESPLNPPVGSKRWNQSLSKFQNWDGAAWIDLVLSIAGGGTGATNPTDFLTNFGLGSMSTQNSNAVTITGGNITGLANLSTLGNIAIAGQIIAGSAPTTVTDSAGRVLESSIADANILARVAGNETITGGWTFTQPLNLQGAGPGILINDSTSTTNQKRLLVQQAASVFAISLLDDAGNGKPYLVSTRNGNTPTVTTTYGSWVFDGSVTIAGTVAFTTEVHVGNYSIPTLIKFKAPPNANAGLEFYNTGDVKVGQIIQNSITLFIDQDVITFRTSSGTLPIASFLSRDNKAVINGVLRLPAGILHRNNETRFISFPDAGAVTLYSNTGVNFATDADVTYLVTTTNSLALPTVGSVLFIGGTDVFNSISLRNDGTDSHFGAVKGTGSLYLKKFDGTVLVTFAATGAIIPIGPINLPAGLPASPSLTVGLSNAGMYYNTGQNTLEFGTGFALTTRSLIRSYNNLKKIDFLVGTRAQLSVSDAWVILGDYAQAVLDAGGSDVMHCGNTYPFQDNRFNCGVATNRWATIGAVNGVIQTSDVRNKRIEGKIQRARDIVKAISPFMGSTPPAMGQKERTVPMFGAQEVDVELPDVVHKDNSDSWMMNYSNMIPVLWQAVQDILNDSDN